MKTLLAEQPWTVTIMLGSLGGCLLYGWLQTGKKTAAVIGLVCLLMIPGAFALAASWQTDREAIRTILYETAAAVEANDHAKVASIIGDERTKQMAMNELPKFVFEMAEVNSIRRIKIDEGSVPLQAQVAITVKADVSGKRGRFANVRVLRVLDLEFEKRGENWVVTYYRHTPIAGGSDAFTSNLVVGR